MALGVSALGSRPLGAGKAAEEVAYVRENNNLNLNFNNSAYIQLPSVVNLATGDTVEFTLAANLNPNFGVSRIADVLSALRISGNTIFVDGSGSTVEIDGVLTTATGLTRDGNPHTWKVTVVNATSIRNFGAEPGLNRNYVNGAYSNIKLTVGGLVTEWAIDSGHPTTEAPITDELSLGNINFINTVDTDWSAYHAGFQENQTSYHIPVRDGQFLYPNRKPVGAVEIDWSHPLAKRLVGCWLFQEGKPTNLAKSKGVLGDGVSDYYAPERDRLVAPVVQANSSSLLSHEDVDVSDGGSIVVALQYESHPGRIGTIACLSDIVNGGGDGFVIGVDGQSIIYTHYGYSSQYTGTKRIGITTGTHLTISATQYSGTDHNQILIVNGQIATEAYNNYWQHGAGLSANDGYGSTRGQIKGSYDVYLAFDAELPEEALLSLNRNPYQFLKPATPSLLRINIRGTVDADLAGYFIPDSRLASPQFYYPNRKPVGQVEIDWGHPLARGLQVCVLPGTHQQELVHGFNLLKRNGATTEVTRNGLAFETSAANAVIELEGSSNLLLAADQDISMFQFTYIDTADQDGTLMSKRDGSSTNWQYWTSSGTQRLSVGGSSGAVATSAFVGTWKGLGASINRASSNYSYYSDGKPNGSGTGTFAHVEDSSPISIGARWQGYPTTGYPGDFTSTIHLVWYGRELTAEEHLSLSRNPYQLLKPKGVPPVKIVTSTVVSTAILNTYLAATNIAKYMVGTVSRVAVYLGSILIHKE